METAEVEPQWFSGWLPIARSPHGIDFLCLDYEPTAMGTEGQIVFVSLDDDERYCQGEEESPPACCN